MAEEDKLFPHVLKHCPSINSKYQILVAKRNEYRNQSVELKENKFEEWRQDFIKIERELKEALYMSLLKHEYLTNKCDLCIGLLSYVEK